MMESKCTGERSIRLVLGIVQWAGPVRRARPESDSTIDPYNPPRFATPTRSRPLSLPLVGDPLDGFAPLLDSRGRRAAAAATELLREIRRTIFWPVLLVSLAPGFFLLRRLEWLLDDTAEVCVAQVNVEEKELNF